jgi:hypothetical protein
MIACQRARERSVTALVFSLLGESAVSVAHPVARSAKPANARRRTFMFHVKPKNALLAPTRSHAPEAGSLQDCRTTSDYDKNAISLRPRQK